MTTDPATRPNQSNPLTGVGDQEGGGQAPVAGQQAGPGSHDAALDHHDRHAVEQGLHPVLANGGVDASAVDLAEVAHERREGPGVGPPVGFGER